MKQGRASETDENSVQKFSRILIRGSVCLVLLLCASVSLAADGAMIHLVSDSWPPFTGESEGQRVAIELVQTALERAGFSAETTIVDWKIAARGLRTGAYDGSAAIWKNADREVYLVFSQPYLENQLVLIGRKGTKVNAVRIADLTGKRVAVVGHYAYGKEINKAEGVLFVNGHSDQDNLNKMLAGDVDYMLVDELVVRYLVTSQPEAAAEKLEIGTTVLARRKLYFALRREYAEAEAIMAAFNREIRKMMADGTYIEILQLPWIRVDVDGDGLVELVALGDRVGSTPPASVYDVFAKDPGEEPPEKPRILIKGNIYKGWDAIPDAYKGPSGKMEGSYKRGVTLGTLRF